MTVVDGRKRCSKCGEVKPTSDFSPHKMAADRLQSYCKTCSAKRAAEWNRTHRERAAEKVRTWQREHRERVLALHRRSRYGIEPEEYDAMVARQGGACAICKTQQRLYIDYDRQAGRVGGLLCGSCSTVLRVMHRDPRQIRAVLKYLEGDRA